MMAAVVVDASRRRSVLLLLLAFVLIARTATTTTAFMISNNSNRLHHHLVQRHPPHGDGAVVGMLPHGRLLRRRQRHGATNTALFVESSSNSRHDSNDGIHNKKKNRMGPIVLIGRQTERRRELDLLAEFLHGVLNNDTGGSSSVRNALRIYDDDDNNDATAPSSPQQQQVYILDIANENDDSVSIETKKDWRSTAAAFHRNKDALMIYTNVRQRQSSDEDVDDDDNDDDEAMDEEEDAFLVEHSDYELCLYADENDDGQEDWEHASWELLRLVARARTPMPQVGSATTASPNNAYLTMGQHTFFLSLTYPEITENIPFDQFCRDVDAFEYRVDLLKDRHDRFAVIKGMQEIRRLSRPYAIRVPALSHGDVMLTDVVPIVYTVRTRNQAGTYDDDAEGIVRMTKSLQWGLRAGVEVLDVESAWPDLVETIFQWVTTRNYASQILGSHHVVGGPTIELDEAVTLFQQCELNGRAHGTKLVLSIDNEDDDRMAYQAGLIASELARQQSRPVVPNIALILGEIGQFSRVINLPFTPVTHAALPYKAAPGQMTASEIMTTRLLTKIFQPLTYCILGHNIAYSVSPQMHSAAFAACQLPHKYVRADVATVEEFVNGELWQSGDFGGTSVTIPHKQSIIPYVDVMSDEAAAIGSVNTIIAKDEFVVVGSDDVDGNDSDDNEDVQQGGSFQRVIYGDNTDWKGIYNPLHRLLGSSNGNNDDNVNALEYCLIVGAGGTARAAAYVAARKLGLQPLYYNRTPAKAQELAERFGGQVVDSLDEGNAGSGDGSSSLGQVLGQVPGAKIRVVISTLPAVSKFVLPEWILTRAGSGGGGGTDKPIVFDVNYKPYYTELLKQAESLGCRVVRGSEMLWEQGVGQFELWMGRTAPYAVMKEVVLQNCLADAAEKQEEASAAAVPQQQQQQQQPKESILE
jgi:3-dehydroquinate dehydratase type I